MAVDDESGIASAARDVEEPSVAVQKSASFLPRDRDADF
jgi:hypothetical protein